MHPPFHNLVRKACTATWALFLAAVLLGAGPAAAQPKEASEYDLKAAYLYRFLLFVEKPPAEDPDAPPPDTVWIGLVGGNPFGDAFKPVEGKRIGDTRRVLRIRQLGANAGAADLASCDVLFLSVPKRKTLQNVLRRVAGKPVLTVSDRKGFLEAGGMINLVRHEKTVRWELNYAVIRKSGLTASSQLWRNAVRVLDGPDRDEAPSTP